MGTCLACFRKTYFFFFGWLWIHGACGRGVNRVALDPVSPALREWDRGILLRKQKEVLL